MASFFRGNAQSTPFQQAIEKITDGNQATEDWGSIMKICDHVSMHDDSAKEAMKVIRKNLQINPVTSGWRSISLTLTLLEALTKNCGKIFHLQIAQKDFLKEFQGILHPKNSPPEAIQQQVLGMIQIWAVAFRDDPDLKSVEQFYQECKQQGIAFPPAEPDNIVKAAVSTTGTIERSSTYARSMSQPAMGSVPRQVRLASDGPNEQMVVRQITAEQMAKLRSELDVVQANGQIFGEMLITLQPGEEHPQDLELLLELEKTCKQMQLRIIDLLSQVSIDDITVDLLRYNDEFNHSFITFESYMKERERRVGPSIMPILNQPASPVRTTPTMSQSGVTHALSSPRKQDNEPALIKFDDDSGSLSPGLQNLSFYHSSPETVPKPIPQQTTASVTTRSVSNNQDSEHEVEQWLNIQPAANIKEESHSTEQIPKTVNQFLEKRASAISDEPISEQQTQIDLQQPSSTNNPNA